MDSLTLGTEDAKACMSLYFARCVEWDWHNDRQIHLFDRASKRWITLDAWPQIIYLAAEGRTTIGAYLEQMARRYPVQPVPSHFLPALMETLLFLQRESKVLQFSATPIDLAPEYLYPRAKR